MIALDTSALYAVLASEPDAERCIEAIRSAGGTIISAATVAEALIVAARRGVRLQMERLIAEIGPEVVSVTLADAHRCAEAHDRWSRGRHGLNYGDCFAYALAKARDCPLLFVGHDFARTDIVAAVT